MRYDLVVTGGFVVDGTGAAGRVADVAIVDGRIAAVGPDLAAEARAVLDADGMVIAPGFIDVHTHYDAQVMWDPAVTPSVFHGITSVIGGNCGFGIAPITPDAGTYLVPMLARVEGMSADALAAGIDLDWSTFSSWLDAIDGRLAINAGFLVGHSTVRRVVMGDGAVGDVASPEQVDAMVRLVHESIEGGALGFSSSRGPTHLDHLDQPVPSRFASDEELLALSHAVSAHDGTSLSYMPGLDPVFPADLALLIASMSIAARRPLNWNTLGSAAGPAAAETQASRLAASDIAARAGGKVVALAMPSPTRTRLSFHTGFMLDSIPGWGDVLHQPLEQRIRSLGDPAVRQQLRATGADSHWARWGEYTISDVADPTLRDLVGRSVASIADERGVDALDAVLDVALADGLRTGLMTATREDSDAVWHDRAALWQDPRVVIGASDAGAHVDFLAAFAMYTEFLAIARDRGLLRLEEAVRLITQVPAALYGLRGRGEVVPGAHADLVVFDPATVGAAPVEPRYDLPAKAMRLYGEATGIRDVIVNGTVAIRDAKLTGSLTGTALRSGRDTETPRLGL